MTRYPNPVPISWGEGVDPMLECGRTGNGATQKPQAINDLEPSLVCVRCQNFARTAVAPFASIRWTDLTTSRFAGSARMRTFPLALLFTVPAL